MKQLSQVIAISIFGVNAIQIILAIGAGIIFLQMLVHKLAGRQSQWKIRKRNLAIENDMWFIE